MTVRFLTVLLIALPMLFAPASAEDARRVDVDPTKNVLDLVQAAIKRQDDLRDAESKFQDAMRLAETRRINDLAAQKQLFDLELARVLRANVDSAALLLSTQLKEVKADLSDRTAKLEQYRYESSGRGSGMGDVIAWAVAAFMGLIAFASLAVGFINMRRAPAAP